MRTTIIPVMLTLAAVAAMVLAAATTNSVPTFAGGQKPSAANELAGTSWKLVKFQGGDETTLVAPLTYRAVIIVVPWVRPPLTCMRPEASTVAMLWLDDHVTRLVMSAVLPSA